MGEFEGAGEREKREEEREKGVLLRDPEKKSEKEGKRE